MTNVAAGRLGQVAHGVPRTLRLVVEEIVGITDAVCVAVLDEEYADQARRAAAKLARKRPSPLVGGRRDTWAAGIVYALGQANFLSDPAREPCMAADQLSEAFRVAKSTMGSKAKQVRDLLRISPFALEFQRADVAERNPLVWFIEVNGLVMDARSVPLAIQVEAHRRGLIPYVPDFGPEGMAPAPCDRAPNNSRCGAHDAVHIRNLVSRPPQQPAFVHNPVPLTCARTRLPVGSIGRASWSRSRRGSRSLYAALAVPAERTRSPGKLIGSRRRRRFRLGAGIRR